MKAIMLFAGTGIVWMDALVVYVASSNGMKYPFMAAAIANMLLLGCVYAFFIGRMILRP